MPRYVTVAQVDKRLRLDLSADLGDPSADAYTADRVEDVELAIEQASQVVANYITDPEPYWEASDADNNVPGDVSAATLLVVQSLIDDSRKADMLSGIAANDPANPVVSLLWRRHIPALA